MKACARLALNDEGFVFDPASGESFLVNACGLSILRSLQEGLRGDQLARALTERFEVAAEVASGAVCDFLGRMRSLGLS